ncbi:2-polyprenylphenol hydroxylase-like oxidoreductase [Gammaproteobacteria bacterium]
MNKHLITLSTRDTQQLQFDCRENEDVISAAERHNIILPQQCRSGACGYCTATIVKGDYILSNYNKAALSDEQHAQQYTLLCRTYPKSDLHIAANYNYSLIRLGNIPEASFTIIEKQFLTAHVIRLVLQQSNTMDNLLSANIIAGQYMYLMPSDKSIKRAYSLANFANWQGQLEFLIFLQPEGQFSRFLQNATKGDRMIAAGPQGNFNLHENGLKPRWFIAGGTGLSPVLAMLRQMADFQEMHPTHLFFGLRYAEDIFCEKELIELKQALPNFNFQICLSRAQPDWTGGYRDSVLNALTSALKNIKQSTDIYLCGSDRLVDEILILLKTYKIKSDEIYYERFTG